MRRRFTMLVFTGAFAGALALAGAGALAQAEAERQLDAALERLRASFGPAAELTVDTRQVDPVTGRARLGGVTISGPAERITLAELTVEEVTESRLGRAEARAIVLRTKIGAEEDRFEMARLVLGGMTLPAPGSSFSLATFALDQMELEGLRGTGESGTMTVGRATAEGYGPGVLGAATLEGVDFREGKDGVSFRLGRVAVQALVMPPLDAGPPDPRQFSVQNLALEGAALRDPDEDVDLAIGRFALRDWVRGRTTDLAIEELRIGAPFGAMGPGDVRIGRIALRGLDAATTLAAVMDGVQIPDPVPGMPQTMTVEGLTAQISGQQTVSLGRLLIDASMAPSGLVSGGIGLQGLQVVLPPGTATWLEQAGYRELAGGLALQGTVRREGGLMNIEPFRIAWNEAATLSLRAEMTGMPVPQPGETRDSDAYMEQLMMARFVGATLSLRDQGLLGRAIAVQARQQRIPEGQLREQMAQMALGMPVPGEERAPRRAAPPRKGAPPAAATTGPDPLAELRQAVARFIRQSGELEIALRPAQPVSFGDMEGFGRLGPVETARRLGLRATAR